jgi:hypothetical protein
VVVHKRTASSVINLKAPTACVVYDRHNDSVTEPSRSSLRNAAFLIAGSMGVMSPKFSILRRHAIVSSSETSVVHRNMREVQTYVYIQWNIDSVTIFWSTVLHPMQNHFDNLTLRFCDAFLLDP